MNKTLGNIGTSWKSKSRVAKSLVIVAAATVAVFHSVGWSDSDPSAAPASTQPTANLVSKGTDPDGSLKLLVNKSGVVSTRVPYKRLNIAQPEIADVNAIGPQTVLVTGKKPGTTQLTVWDDADRTQVIDITVSFDVQELQDKVNALFPGRKIEVLSLNGSVALKGRVSSLDEAERAQLIAAPYTQQKVMNFLEITGGQQVMLQVRFAEVSRTATNQLGVNFGFSDGKSSFGNNIGQVSAFGPGVNAAGSLDTGTLTSAGAGSAVTMFGGGQAGNASFEYFLDALRENNLLRVLAEPNLIAMSGQEASFLAGGEFPIPVPQSSGSGSSGGAVTVEFKQFGIRLSMVPLVMGDSRIRLKVAPEVSDLDFTNAVVSSGFRIPALTKRSVNTTVELNEGQTFAIAGLLNTRIQANNDMTPVLGDIPVLGALFRSVAYERKETELVVLVTPHLVAGMNPDQAPSVPGEKWRNPSEKDLFLKGDIGSALPPDRPGDKSSSSISTATTRPVTAENDNTPPVEFKGEYGFAPAASVTSQPAAPSASAGE